MEQNERIATLEALMTVARREIERNQERIKALEVQIGTEKVSHPRDIWKWLSAIFLGMMLMVKEVRAALGEILGRFSQ